MAHEKKVAVADDGTEFDTLEEAEIHDALCKVQGDIDAFCKQYCAATGRTERYAKKLSEIILQYEQSRIVGPEAMFRDAEAA